LQRHICKFFVVSIDDYVLICVDTAMHLRLSTVKRKGKTYRYAQLVESYRRSSDGMPAHRVVAHLGDLSQQEIANLRAALSGNRQGKRLQVARSSTPPRPSANLRYLDLAVLLSMWRQLGLEDLLGKLVGRGDADVSPAAVLAALVMHRCVDPGSKLSAQRWFPRTALPELLAIDPGSFNNTRLHRVLNALDAATPALMERLPTLFLERDRNPAFAALFLDVSDSYFEGHGPKEMAIRGKTKEGLLRRKIGIVLLCNERGYPLRWRVVAGNASDCRVMTAVFRSIARSRWAEQTPIVCDRAMGTTALLHDMAATGLHFLTALRTTEYDSYAHRLPHAAFAALDVPENASDSLRASICRKAREQAQQLGLESVSGTLWTKDFGTVQIGASNRLPTEVSSCLHGSPVAEALFVGRKIEQAVTSGETSTFNAASRALGIVPATGKKYRELCRLPQDIQQAILDGEAPRCSIAELLTVARLKDADQQRSRFAALLETASARPKHPPSRSPPSKAKLEPFCVRVVAYFNPERFVEQREASNRQQARISAFERDLNQRLASSHCRLKRAGVLAAIDRRLRRDDLLEAYRVDVTEIDIATRVHYHVALHPIPSEWQRRRRYHGFTVLVGHPELSASASELCQLYRSKDMVEKDFQVIKSIVKLRPIRHHTEAKVSAHVTLCVLALLLERHLEALLSRHSTAHAALETLSTCHLNQYRAGQDRPLYVLTEADEEQLALLRKLNLPLLADDDDLAAHITPR
jgi:hypothetical protein